jgi:hypothetical protein
MAARPLDGRRAPLVDGAIRVTVLRSSSAAHSTAATLLVPRLVVIRADALYVHLTRGQSEGGQNSPRTVILLAIVLLALVGLLLVVRQR